MEISNFGNTCWLSQPQLLVRPHETYLTLFPILWDTSVNEVVSTTGSTNPSQLFFGERQFEQTLLLKLSKNVFLSLRLQHGKIKCVRTYYFLISPNYVESRFDDVICSWWSRYAFHCDCPSNSSKAVRTTGNNCFKNMFPNDALSNFSVFFTFRSHVIIKKYYRLQC